MAARLLFCLFLCLTPGAAPGAPSGSTPAATPGAASGAPSGSPPLVSLPLQRPVVVDGDLSEWDPKASLELCRANQLNKIPGSSLSRDWGGEKDISAVIYLRHSRDALYIGGTIRDDDILFKDVHWWNGDAIEIFLDTDYYGDREDSTFSDDDYQIFLMPYNEGRPWGVSFQGRRSVLGDDGFVGVEVAHKSFDGGYSFEAVFPFVNFPFFDPSVKVLGFNAALSDHDVLPGGRERHNYMTLNGASNVFKNPRKMCLLELRGEPLAGTGTAKTGRAGTAYGFVFTIVLALLAILAVAFFSVKIYNAAQRYFPRWRYYGVGLFFLFLAVILFLPRGIVHLRTAGVDSLLEECSDPLPPILEELCSPDVNEGRGGIRSPEAIKALLAGEKVPVRPAFEYSLVDLGSERVIRKSLSGTPFLVYGFPLREGERYVFPCRSSNPFDGIALALRVFFKSPLARGVAPEGVIEGALKVGAGLEGKGNRPLVALDLCDSAAPSRSGGKGVCSRAWLDRDGSRWDEYTVRFPADLAGGPVRSVSLRLVNPNVKVVLAGVTGLPAGRGGKGPVPFFLGNETLTGIPTWLRDGTMPSRCERIIGPPPRPGGKEEGKGVFSFPVSGSPDVLFLVYTSKDDTLFEKEKYGAEVARVLLHYADGTTESKAILAGVHVDHWTRNHPEAMESKVAYRWTRGGQTLHDDILRIELDSSNPLRKVSVANTDADGKPFILCGATLGTRVRRRPFTSVLLREEGDSLYISSAVLSGVRRLAFTLFEDGVARASSHAPEIASRLIGTRIPRAAGRIIPHDDFVLSSPSPFQAGGKKFLGVYIGFPAKGGGRCLLRGALEIEPLAATGEVQSLLAITAVVLFLPFFIMFFVDLLGRIRMIRLKLTSLFVLTSVVPIVFLSLLMVNHLGRLRDEQIREHLLGAVKTVKERLNGLVTAQEKAARALLNSSDLLGLVSRSPAGGSAVSSLLSRFAGGLPHDGIKRAVRLEMELEGGERRLFFGSGEDVSSSLFEDVESGFYFHWGRFYFVATAARKEKPSLKLSVGGVVTCDYLKSLARDLDLSGMVVGDAETGYPVVDAGIREDLARRERRQAAANEWIEERKEPFVGERSDGVLVALDTITPRGRTLGLEAQKARKGFLLPVSLFLGRMEVTDFFLLFGAVILAAAIFIAMVTTDRITKPIEKLKRGALEVSRGNLAYTLDEESGDEMGSLARAFNDMTGKLAFRVEEQERLTRNMRELSTGLEFQEKADKALRILAGDLGAERAVFFLWDNRMGRFEVAGDTRGKASHSPFVPGGGFLARGLVNSKPAVFPEPERSPAFAGAAPVEKDVIEAGRGLIVLPLEVSRRKLGVVFVVLDREAARHPRANPGYLAAMAQQIAVALENARLYLMAIQDPDTGFYLRSFFHHRLAEELDRTVHSGGRLALLRLALRGGGGESGGEGADGLLRKACGVVREICRDMYIVGHGRAGELDILLPDAGAGTAVGLARSLERGFAASLEKGTGASPGGEGEGEPRLRFGLALCPDDATSTEFLLDRVARSLEEGSVAMGEDRVTDGEGMSGEGEIELFGYVFRAPRMREILGQIPRIARSSVSVLILGETGVGKEVLAEIIHRSSNRADRPFVMLNCSALPESLLESELFGHEKGAFTGAERRKAGHFEVADKGTLFLDEVGDLSLRTQAKLLRVLQDRTFEPLGSSGKPRRVDVRIIAATNRDLKEEIEKGRFREDLYFRLKVVTLVVPPLRERKEDIPALALRFIREFNRENNRSVLSLSPAALDRCHRYSWPGNVRELRNVLSRAFLFVEGKFIEPSHLMFESGAGTGVSALSGTEREDIMRDLNQRQARLIAHLKVHGAITNKEYIEMMGISSRTGLRDLKELMERGMIVRLGSRRGAAYRLKG